MSRTFQITIVGLLALFFGFQNCSMTATHQSGYEDFSSKSCEAAVAAVYRQTYYPAFRTACTSCHDTGGTSGRPFASANFNEAFNSFISVTRNNVERMAVNPGHQPPRTGPQHQALIDSAQDKFKEAEAIAAKCTSATNIETISKPAPANVYTGNPPNPTANWPRLTFDLTSELADPSLAGQIRLTVSVEIRRGVINNQTVGYEFKNPRVAVTGSAPLPAYQIQGIKILKNGELLKDFTFFDNVDVVVNSGTETLMQPGGNFAIAVGTVENTDTFALRFGKILDGSGKAITGSGGGGGGGGGGTLPDRITFSDLVSGNQTLGVFSRACINCHSNNNPQGGLNLQSYQQAQQSALLIQSRMYNAANPMPPTGLLPANDRAVVDIWISSGTPQN